MPKIILAVLILLLPGCLLPTAAQTPPPSPPNSPLVSSAGHAGFVEGYMVLMPEPRKEEMQFSLNGAAQQGYRFAGIAVGNRAFTVMSRPHGWSGGAHYEYFIVTTRRGSTLDKELIAAYQDGWRLRELIGIDHTPAPFLNLAVLEKEIGKPPGAEEMRFVHAQRPSSLEKEIQQGAGEGFRLVGVCESLWGLSAVMTRPAGATPEARFSYRITHHPEEVAAEGYRPLKTFHAVVAGGVLLEKDAHLAPPKADLKLVAPWQRSTLVRQLEESESGGYRLAAMDGIWRTLWVKSPEMARAGYSYMILNVSGVDRKGRAVSPLAGQELSAGSVSKLDSAGKSIPVTPGELEGYAFVTAQSDSTDEYQMVFEKPRQAP